MSFSSEIITIFRVNLLDDKTASENNTLAKDCGFGFRVRKFFNGQSNEYAFH
jgi:hypothetical protein